MYVGMYVCMYVCTYVCMYVLCIYVCVYLCTYVCVCVCVCVCVHARMYVGLCMVLFIQACMCVFIERYAFIHSFIQYCLTTGPKPPPKRCLHIVRSRAFSFKWEYTLLSLRSSSSFLLLIPRLLVTSISPFIFPSITCFRRQFLRKMWPI